jgi:hypothetical protein
MAAITYPSPSGQTAFRLEWPHLPPWLRSEIETRLGCRVVDAISQDGGFTPGFASVLVCEDGSRAFVKAASTIAQRVFAGAYRDEARALALLPADVPAAPLRWLIDDEWVVLGIEYVEGRLPHRPWTGPDLDACLDALERVAERLTPPPAAMDLESARHEFATWPAYWEQVAPRPHQDEAAALAARYADVLAGTTLAHTDIRDDNVLVTPHGVVFCDWNWPIAAAPWFDSLALLIGPRGDGLDVAAVIAERPLLRDVPAEHLDVALALLAGYFLKCAADPHVHNSPHLRKHQAWFGEVCWEWLAERRGWDLG